MTRRGRGSWRRLWDARGEREIEDELEFHLAMRVRDLMATGLSEAAARLQARQGFGSVSGIRSELAALDADHTARTGRLRLVSESLGDVRIGLRGLRRSPAYAASILLTLTLVIAATSSIYSLVNAVLLTPLPYPSPSELVAVWEHNLPRANDRNVVSVPMYEAWRERAQSLVGAAALVPDRQTLTVGQAERISGAAVTSSWFEVVGIPPARGRGFSEAEARAGDVVVLSYGLWREYFNADERIVGQRITLSGAPWTVVGVMPEGFEPPAFGWLGSDQRYWVPFVPDEGNRTWGRFLLVLGRLAPTASAAVAEAELQRIVAERAQDEPALESWTANVLPLHEEVAGDMRTPLIALAVGAGCLLLLGLVNVTNLLLVRVDRRAAEFSVRAAIGAGRGRLARQLMAEAVAIAAVAAPIGCVLAWVALKGLRLILPMETPRLASVGLDATAVLICAGVALAATVVLGLVPHVRLRRQALYDRLRSTTAPRRGSGRVLVVTEVALALVLAVGAGLTLRSFTALRSVPLGFDADGVTAFRVSLPAEAYGSPEARTAFFQQLLERLSGTRGVTGAAAVSVRPLSSGGAATTVVPMGEAPPESPPVADIRIATAGYFTMMGIRTVRGEGLETSGAARRVVINETLARTFWADGNPRGARLLVALNGGDTVEVAGVVQDVRIAGPQTELRPTVYYPHHLGGTGAMDVLVRATLPPDEVVSLARAAVAELNASLPLENVARLEAVVSQTTARQRAESAVLGAFAVLALLLAATGIYGVLAMEVVERRREIGIRIALGEAPASVSARVVASALVMAGTGLAFGMAGAIILTRFMSSMLYGVAATDAATYGAVVAILLAVSLLAAWSPARRAARADPMASLRG